MDEQNIEVKGRAKGGKARAEKMSPEERKASAMKAAKARWEELPTTKYVGTLQLGDMSFPCAVLPDGTRVLTESNFMKGLGMYRSGALSTRRNESADAEGSAQVPLYLSFKNLQPFVAKYLGDMHTAPVLYRTESGNTAHGIPAAIIPKICTVWMEARKSGVLGPRQLIIADNAEMLLRALAEVGLVALVDEATGFQAVRPQNALQQYLEKLVRKELAVWAKKFPDEFYENIYKLRNWQWAGMGKNRYSAVAGYTRDLIYERMAPSLLDELVSKSPKDEKGNRPNKLHQWLSDDIGNPMLASHMQSILTLQRLAIANGWGWQRFVGMVDQVLPRKGSTLSLPFETM